MSRPGNYRTQVIRATGQAVYARWNVNSKSLDDRIRFDSDGAPVPAGLAMFLRDQIHLSMELPADDIAAERAEATAIVYREYGVHDRTAADRKLTAFEWSRCAGNPNGKY